MKFQGASADPREGVSEIVRNWPFYFADEAKGQVQLFIVLPAKVGALVHGIDQQAADWLGRSDGDEQTVHEP